MRSRILLTSFLSTFLLANASPVPNPQAGRTTVVTQPAPTSISDSEVPPASETTPAPRTDGVTIDLWYPQVPNTFSLDQYTYAVLGRGGPATTLYYSGPAASTFNNIPSATPVDVEEILIINESGIAVVNKGQPRPSNGLSGQTVEDNAIAAKCTVQSGGSRAVCVFEGGAMTGRPLATLTATAPGQTTQVVAYPSDLAQNVTLPEWYYDTGAAAGRAVPGQLLASLVTLPPDIHPLPEDIQAYFVYPYSLEDHVLHPAPPHVSHADRLRSLQEQHEKRVTFLKDREDEKNRKKREQLRKVAPGWEPSDENSSKRNSGILEPNRKAKQEEMPANILLTEAEEQHQPTQAKERDVMDDLVEGLAKLDSEGDKA